MVKLANSHGDGWELESAEARHVANPDTFWIPPRAQREGLQPGDGAKLLFQIGSAGRTGVERMWVIVHRRTDDGYVGVLDSTPTSTDPGALSLVRGAVVACAPEHVADISTPARDYVIRQYGQTFFSDADASSADS